MLAGAMAALAPFMLDAQGRAGIAPIIGDAVRRPA